MVATPRSSAAAFISSSATGIPADRKFIAMPPPIVPAPTIATRPIARTGVASGTPDTRAAARSAKNACRSARDSGVARSSRNSLRSWRSPSSNGMVTAAATASTHLRGAGKRPAAAATELRANWKYASAFG